MSETIRQVVEVLRGIVAGYHGGDGSPETVTRLRGEVCKRIAFERGVSDTTVTSKFRRGLLPEIDGTKAFDLAVWEWISGGSQELQAILTKHAGDDDDRQLLQQMFADERLEHSELKPPADRAGARASAPATADRHMAGKPVGEEVASHAVAFCAFLREAAEGVEGGPFCGEQDGCSLVNLGPEPQTILAELWSLRHERVPDETCAQETLAEAFGALKRMQETAGHIVIRSLAPGGCSQFFQCVRAAFPDPDLLLAHVDDWTRMSFASRFLEHCLVSATPNSAIAQLGSVMGLLGHEGCFRAVARLLAPPRLWSMGQLTQIGHMLIISAKGMEPNTANHLCPAVGLHEMRGARDDGLIQAWTLVWDSTECRRVVLCALAGDNPPPGWAAFLDSIASIHPSAVPQLAESPGVVPYLLSLLPCAAGSDQELAGPGQQQAFRLCRRLLAATAWQKRWEIARYLRLTGAVLADPEAIRVVLRNASAVATEQGSWLAADALLGLMNELAEKGWEWQASELANLVPFCIWCLDTVDPTVDEPGALSGEACACFLQKMASRLASMTDLSNQLFRKARWLNGRLYGTDDGGDGDFVRYAEVAEDALVAFIDTGVMDMGDGWASLGECLCDLVEESEPEKGLYPEGWGFAGRVLGAMLASGAYDAEVRELVEDLRELGSPAYGRLADQVIGCMDSGKLGKERRPFALDRGGLYQDFREEEPTEEDEPPGQNEKRPPPGSQQGGQVRRGEERVYSRDLGVRGFFGEVPDFSIHAVEALLAEVTRLLGDRLTGFAVSRWKGRARGVLVEPNFVAIEYVLTRKAGITVSLSGWPEVYRSHVSLLKLRDGMSGYTRCQATNDQELRELLTLLPIAWARKSGGRQTVDRGEAGVRPAPPPAHPAGAPLAPESQDERSVIKKLMDAGIPCDTIAQFICITEEEFRSRPGVGDEFVRRLRAFRKRVAWTAVTVTEDSSSKIVTDTTSAPLAEKHLGSPGGEPRADMAAGRETDRPRPVTAANQASVTWAAQSARKDGRRLSSDAPVAPATLTPPPALAVVAAALTASGRPPATPQVLPQLPAETPHAAPLRAADVGSSRPGCPPTPAQGQGPALTGEGTWPMTLTRRNGVVFPLAPLPAGDPGYTSHLDERGLAKVGTEVRYGQVLVRQRGMVWRVPLGVRGTIQEATVTLFAPRPENDYHQVIEQAHDAVIEERLAEWASGLERGFPADLVARDATYAEVRELRARLKEMTPEAVCRIEEKVEEAISLSLQPEASSRALDLLRQGSRRVKEAMANKANELQLWAVNQHQPAESITIAIRGPIIDPKDLDAYCRELLDEVVAAAESGFVRAQRCLVSWVARRMVTAPEGRAGCCERYFTELSEEYRPRLHGLDTILFGGEPEHQYPFGNPRVPYHLGVMLEHGLGGCGGRRCDLECRHRDMRGFYMDAALGGECYAALRVAEFYEAHPPLSWFPHDRGRAWYWYRKAEPSGRAEAHQGCQRLEGYRDGRNGWRPQSEDLGRAIRGYLDQGGITDGRMAARLGVEVQTLRNWYGGQVGRIREHLWVRLEPLIRAHLTDRANKP
jgi:hypothetical protein